MARASAPGRGGSLLEVDLQLAEEVISEDVRVDEIRAAAEEKAFALLALQAPVATGLRIVVSAIHGAGDIERMGDLALHVAQVSVLDRLGGQCLEELLRVRDRIGRRPANDGTVINSHGPAYTPLRNRIKRFGAVAPATF